MHPVYLDLAMPNGSMVIHCCTSTIHIEIYYNNPYNRNITIFSCPRLLTRE